MMMKVRDKLLDKRNYKDVAGNGIVTDVVQEEGKYGDEFHIYLKMPDGEISILSVWQTHLRQLAKDLNDKETDNWKGKTIHFKAVTVVNSKGIEALGWTTYVPK